MHRAVWGVLFACLCGCGADPPASAIKGVTGQSLGKQSSPATIDASIPATALRFVDVTDQTGIDFSYRDGQETNHYALIEMLGGGPAACDFDGDGDIDLFVPGGGRIDAGRHVDGKPPAFYRNEGEGRFAASAEPAGFDEPPHYSHGTAAGDYDNDGFADLLVTGWGGLTVYHNQGDGTFLLEDADRLGLADRLWSSSAAWGDFDGDGNLDLYVVHYVDWSFDNDPLCLGANPDQRDLCTPKSFAALPHVLYVSGGDGTFRDVSHDAGLTREGKGLGVVAADIDLDGRIDLYVGNDTTPNFLYHNLGDGRLEEIGRAAGTSVNDQGNPDGSMGVQVLDFNLDGLPDLWVTTYEDESCSLYRNLGHRLFRHVSRVAGIAAAGGMSVGWGTEAADFDRDGDEDLFVTTGHAVRYPKRAPLKQRPLLFENLGNERFANVAASAGEALAGEHLGRGLVAADFDGDGDVDLALCPINERVQLLANESRGANHWLALKLVGTTSNRDGVGALVHIETPSGAQVRQVKGGGSYASTSDRTVYFGMAQHADVLKVEIRWPSGKNQPLSGVKPDRLMKVIEPR